MFRPSRIETLHLKLRGGTDCRCDTRKFGGLDLALQLGGRSLCYRVRRPSCTIIVPRFSCKIRPVVKLRVSLLKTLAKRYFPTAKGWIIFSQALERFLPQPCFRQHH
jgi:hypothetical protein